MELQMKVVTQKPWMVEKKKIKTQITKHIKMRKTNNQTYKSKEDE